MATITSFKEKLKCVDYDSCDCQQCKSKSLIERYNNALKILKDLTKHEEMANRDEPLKDAFELSKEIKKLQGAHLKKDLRRFATECKIFTEGLCNECDGDYEIAALYNFDAKYLKEFQKPEGERESTEMVNMLNEAINANHTKFVAHRHSQLILDTVVNSKFPISFTKVSSLNTLLHYVLYTLLSPIWVVIYLFVPNCKMSKWMNTPYGKFVGQVSQFSVFLILLVLGAFRNSHVPSAIEYLIYIFVLAMIIQEIWRLINGEHYFYKWWNWFTAAMLLIFLAAAVFFVLGFAIAGKWSSTFAILRERIAHRMLLLGNSCFSIASVLSVWHFGNLCQVNALFGPIQISVYRMFKDILKFLTFFLGIFLAFTLGVRNLYSYSRSLQLEIIMKENSTEIIIVKTNRRLNTFWDAMKTMFWMLFDQSDLDDFYTSGKRRFKITQETGEFLFGAFSICAVLVGVNMLIAMMNNSYEFFAKDNKSEHWKFSRTRMWLEFVGEKNYYLPPPYNLIQILVYINDKISPKRDKKRQDKTNDEEERKEIVRAIVSRYLQKRKEIERRKEWRMEIGSTSDNEVPLSPKCTANSVCYVSNV